MDFDKSDPKYGSLSEQLITMLCGSQNPGNAHSKVCRYSRKCIPDHSFQGRITLGSQIRQIGARLISGGHHPVVVVLKILCN